MVLKIILMKCLKKKLNMNFLNEYDIGFSFDYIESELIAYLSARSIHNLPFTSSSTTGVSRPSSGGKIFKHL